MLKKEYVTGKKLLGQALHIQGEGKDISTNNGEGNRFFTSQELDEQVKEKIASFVDSKDKEGLRNFLEEKGLVEPYVELRFDELIKIIRDKLKIQTGLEKYIQGDQMKMSFDSQARD